MSRPCGIMSQSKSPRGINRAVWRGMRRRRREMKGIPGRLGGISVLGIRRVQTHKKGLNQTAADRLREITLVLDVPARCDCNDLGGSVQAPECGFSTGDEGGGLRCLALPGEDIERLTAFRKAGNAALRESLPDIVKAVASATVARA